MHFDKIHTDLQMSGKPSAVVERLVELFYTSDFIKKEPKN